MVRLRVRWFVVPALVVASASLHAQQMGAIRGRVTEASGGGPLADVQVRLEGGTRGTVTRADGSYSLNEVPPGTYDIAARRVGFALERRRITVVAGDTTSQDFVLRVAAITLGDVVITGVVTPTERVQLGNTIASVTGGEITEAPGVTAIDQALQGRVTGAVISENSGQPGGGVSIRLRGTNSILGGAEPLYVIDGVIVDNSSEALVSLGANATRGNAALSNRMADIDPADVERIEILKGAAAAAIYGSRANNGVIQIFTKRGQSGAPRISGSTEISFSNTPKRYDFNMAPTAGQADVSFGGASALGVPVERYDIQDQVFRTARGIRQRLSASGGAGNTSYYLGGSYDNEEGVIRSTDYERVSFRANLSQEISPRLEVAVRGNVLQSIANFVPEGEQGQGVLTSLVFTPTSVNPRYNPDLGRFPYNPILGANPLDVIANWSAPEKVSRFLGGVEGTWRPLPNLSVRYLAGLDDYRREVKYYQPPQSTGVAFAGSIQNPVQFSRLFNNDLAASHQWAATPALELTTSAGFRYTADRVETIRAATGSLLPGQDLIGANPAVPSAAQTQTELRTTSWYLEERASIADRLFLTGGVNWDASSAFGPDERQQMFPRLSASYLIDREEFWEGSIGSFLSSLRLRAAWGETGGQPPGLYSRFANYVNTSYAGRPGLVSSTLAGNENLKPERQREFEGGFDAGFLNDRAQLEFTVYDKKTTDLVLSVPLPPSSAFQQQFQNIGELSNRGIEIGLNTINISRPDFTWRTRLSYAANRNRIEKLVTASDTLNFDYLNAVIVGQPIGVFYGWYYARNPDGTRFYRDTLFAGQTLLLPRRALDTLASGVTVPSRRLLGDPNPDFVATLGSTFEMGRLVTLNVLLDGRFGNDVANFTRRIQDQFGVSKVTEREITGDTVPRTYVLTPYARTLIYEEFIEDGSYVKLREISLQVRLTPGVTRLIGASGGSVRLSGRNLYTWTDYSGLDPEVNLFSANTVSRGVDFATVPLPRQFSLGLSLDY